jgi:NAD(P)-dependent dehydrogenase (short-subunit alcohol dehydrogenase family)
MTDKKVAFITGANRGLGFETARELAENGIHAVIGARDEAQGKAAAKKLSDKGFSAEALVFDVSKPEDHQRAAKYFQDKFGRLDILVNNAGVFIEGRDASQERVNKTSTTSPEILRGTFDVNFFQPVALTQTLLPLLKKSEAGRIVNLSSILGSLALQADPNSQIYNSKVFAYDVSKTALNAFTIHLAHELKDTKIKVNSAHPGWVKTAMGGASAPMDVSEGGKTSVELALLPGNGPSGQFIHRGEKIPW